MSTRFALRYVAPFTVQVLCLVLVRATEYMNFPMFPHKMMLNNPLSSKQYSSIPFERRYHSQMENKPAIVKMRPAMRFKQPSYSAPDNQTMQPVNTILVETPHQQPVNILFRSTSSSVNVLQDHKRAKGVVRYINSQEEPVVIMMNISKPVIQKINELILPQRFIRQEIRPIKETIETIIKESPGEKYTVSDEGHSNEQRMLDEGQHHGMSHGMKQMGTANAYPNQNQFNNIQDYVNYGRNNMDQGNSKNQNFPVRQFSETERPNDGEHSEENYHGEGKSDMSDKYMPVSFNLNDASLDHGNAGFSMNGEYKTRVQNQHNSNIEPVYHESQEKISREDKPDSMDGNAGNSEQLNTTTVAYDDEHLSANSTA